VDITLHIKTNYIVIIVLALATLLGGAYFSWTGMSWYNGLVLPSITPPGWVFSSAWHIIFVLTTLAAILVWNRFERDMKFFLTMALFVLNAFLNVYWTYLFFHKHRIGAALVDAFFLEFSTMLLFVLISQRSHTISFLLLPYATWNLFAIILNFMVWQLN
jgi:benzodiazapine receptor